MKARLRGKKVGGGDAADCGMGGTKKGVSGENPIKKEPRRVVKEGAKERGRAEKPGYIRGQGEETRKGAKTHRRVT